MKGRRNDLIFVDRSIDWMIHWCIPTNVPSRPRTLGSFSNLIFQSIRRLLIDKLEPNSIAVVKWRTTDGRANRKTFVHINLLENDSTGLSNQVHQFISHRRGLVLFVSQPPSSPFPSLPSPVVYFHLDVPRLSFAITHVCNPVSAPLSSSSPNLIPSHSSFIDRHASIAS